MMTNLVYCDYNILESLLSRTKYRDDELYLFSYLSKLKLKIAVDYYAILALYLKGLIDKTSLPDSLTKYISVITVEIKDLNSQLHFKKMFDYYSNTKLSTLNVRQGFIHRYYDTEKEKRIAVLIDLSYMVTLSQIYNRKADLIISTNPLAFVFGKLLNITDKIFSIEDFIELCSRNYRISNISLNIIKTKFRYIDLGDDFFSSFREEYQDFDKWFISKKDEPCYISKLSNNSINAFVYLKIEDINENYSDISPVFAPARRLKVGSLKVKLNGQRLGEIIFKIIFDFAIKESVSEIYLTVFNRFNSRKRLIHYLKRWGFEYHGVKGDTEEVYVKRLKVSMLDGPHLYPMQVTSNNVYLIGIDDFYSNDLFVRDSNSRVSYKRYRNVIKNLVILEEAPDKILGSDILIFYNVTTKKFISVGTVESFHSNINNVGEFLVLCRKRSTLTDNQLKNIYQSNINLSVIKFLTGYMFNRRDTITLGNNARSLLNFCCPEKSRICIKLSNAHFNKLIKGSYYEKNYLIH